MIYNIFIYIYCLGIAVYQLFNAKVRKMWQGEHATFNLLKQKVDPQARYVWFHAASLGEFEQGRPIMERLRQDHPEYKILLTFFSPSGYEVRKDYKVADIVCYLPLDTPANAAHFLHLVQPAMAFFIKYEFWYNYLNILRLRGIPIYSISSIFRPDQIFFKWYGKPYNKVLRCITHFFVQNQESKHLLSSIGINQATITGDTRFDRVLQIKEQSKRLPIIQAFKQDQKVFVAGSSWPPDEEIFINYFNRHPEWRLIIAPHVIGEDHLNQILTKLNRKTVRYTQTTEEEAKHATCMLIDCFGLLSSIYHYGETAYIGGGFGVGIHNVLEAAVWNVPVLFGPNNERFQEAQELKAADGGFQISCYSQFEKLMNRFTTDPAFLTEKGNNAGNYVKSKVGATTKILSSVNL